VKFSILLPTLNRLRYLRQAVETVRRQDYDDWEIVISDNASQEDIAGYVASLSDPRIHYSRSETFLPVTDNWNRCLEGASGDYVHMLGVDDGLAPGQLREVAQQAERYRRPDLLYSLTHHVAYPGVLPGAPEGYVAEVNNASFLLRAREARVLDWDQRLKAVRSALSFRHDFSFDMQHVFVRRDLVEKLRRHGPFFQSPFPDFYAANALFLRAERVLALPRFWTLRGISPKSYGSFHFVQDEEGGSSYLQGEAPRPQGEGLVAGSNMNDSWLLAMRCLIAAHGGDFDLEIDYARYRRLQAAYVGSHMPRAQRRAARGPMKAHERLLSRGAWVGRKLDPLLSRVAARLWGQRFQPYRVRFLEVRAENLLQAFEALAKGS
jgi:glycosyltransferase involved in cell wall biosynthesis